MKDTRNTEKVIFVDSWPLTTEARPQDENLIYSVFVIEIAASPTRILLKQDEQGLSLPRLQLRKTDFLNRIIQDQEEQRIRTFFGSQWGLLPQHLAVIGLLDFPAQKKIIKLISFQAQKQLEHFWQEFPTQFYSLSLGQALPADLVLPQETLTLLAKYSRVKSLDPSQQNPSLQLVQTIVP